MSSHLINSGPSLSSGLHHQPHQPAHGDKIDKNDKINDKINDKTEALRENFMSAVRTSDFKRVKGMLDRGLDPEFQTTSGSPLHVSTLLKGPVALAMVSLLIDAGANVNSQGEFGSSPLHWTCYYGRDDVARLLILRGANVWETDKNLATPLHIAMQLGFLKCLEPLLDFGADPGARDNYGNSLKVNKDHPAMTDFYRSWEAKSLAKKARQEISASNEAPHAEQGVAASSRPSRSFAP